MVLLLYISSVYYIVELVETLAKSQLDQMFWQPTTASLSELLTLTGRDV